MNGGVCNAVQGSSTDYTCDCQGCFAGSNCETSKLSANFIFYGFYFNLAHAWNYTEAMDGLHCPLVLALVPLQKFPIDL